MLSRKLALLATCFFLLSALGFGGMTTLALGLMFLAGSLLV